MAKKDTKPVELNINLDTTPVLFTDNIIITTNKYGVILNSTQQVGPTNQIRIVSRIGMSRVHAKHFVEELGKLLAITEGHTQTGDNKKTDNIPIYFLLFTMGFWRIFFSILSFAILRAT